MGSTSVVAEAPTLDGAGDEALLGVRQICCDADVTTVTVPAGPGGGRAGAGSRPPGDS